MVFGQLLACPKWLKSNLYGMWLALRKENIFKERYDFQQFQLDPNMTATGLSALLLSVTFTK